MCFYLQGLLRQGFPKASAEEVKQRKRHHLLRKILLRPGPLIPVRDVYRCIPPNKFGDSSIQQSLQAMMYGEEIGMGRALEVKRTVVFFKAPPSQVPEELVLEKYINMKQYSESYSQSLSTKRQEQFRNYSPYEEQWTGMPVEPESDLERYMGSVAKATKVMEEFKRLSEERSGVSSIVIQSVFSGSSGDSQELNTSPSLITCRQTLVAESQSPRSEPAPTLDLT